MSLSLIIPVHNDPDGLCQLLEQVAGLGIFEAVIVSDDASDPPCRPADLGFDEAALKVRYLRSETQRGAGHARNRALETVTTEHVLFFDSDDLLLPALKDLWESLQAEAADPFDFCLFRHIDSRQRVLEDATVLGPMPSDQALWARAGVLHQKPYLITPDQVAQLVSIAAYPWNKIYRTEFLREQAISCTEIMVHNDIELHWMSFLKARRILVSAALCCEHIIQAGGNRLTNRRGAERLQVFDALEPVHAVLATQGVQPDLLVAFVGFYTRLFDWILVTLDGAYQAEFRHRASLFLRRHLCAATMALIAVRDPELAQLILSHIREGWS
ncbi:glycosyltransferase family 2 protein [Epibacterium ulvae]|uniref:glycosyltransferase family 2 protein n=1 Tax=Epibacterium ulvae TaxID=1156985 RepID=UPI0024924A0A|nr:glycosyltransferase [Epibacterium ulvae]